MRYCIFLWLSLLISACSESKVPDMTLDEDSKSKLVVALSDMYFIDTWIARTTLSEKDSLRNKLKLEFSQIHNKSMDQVKESITQIQLNPKLYAEIMDSVVVRLKNTQSLTK